VNRDDRSRHTDRFAEPYLLLRGLIGLLGLLLPITVWLVAAASEPGRETPGSISGYYYTDARDVLVGALCAIGVFLVAYRFDSCRRDRISDDALTNIAGVCAIGVALFPTGPPDPPDAPATWVSFVHGGFALVLFALLAFLSYFRFTRCDPGTDERDPAKLRRNRVYRTCGVVIAAALLVAVLDGFLRLRLVPLDDGLYWEETVMVLAFGTSWLVKGRDLWPWQPGRRAQQGRADDERLPDPVT